MAKFNKGDKIRVTKGLFEGRAGIITDPWWQISQSDWPCVEFVEPDGMFVYADEDDMELTEDPYEYMVLRVYSAGGTQNKGSWSTKAEAEAVFKALGLTGADPTWGKWRAKVVKRRKAGPVEDA
jgi:hypothetical protein